MGVSNSAPLTRWLMLIIYRITKLMGESFKLHSLALVGYEEDAVSGSSGSTPAMSSQAAQELDLETTVY